VYNIDNIGLYNETYIHTSLAYYCPVAILHTPSLEGGTASFGGDIGGLGAVPQRVQGQSPLSGGQGGEALRS